MANVSWVAGTTTATTTGTSLASSLPAGINDNDGVFAFVESRSALTPPAGWSWVYGVTFTGGTTTQYLDCYRKDSVTSGNSSQSFTWNQAASAPLCITYAVVRGASGNVTVIQTANSATGSGTTGVITPWALTADRGLEMFLIGASVVNQTTSTYTPTVPSGYTLWSGGVTNNRVAGAYKIMDTGGANSGVFTMSAATSGNALGALTIRVVDRSFDQFVNELTYINQTDNTGGSHYSGSVTEGVGVKGWALYGAMIEGVLADGVAVAQDAAGSLPSMVALTDGVGMPDYLATTRGASLSDTLGVTGTNTYALGLALAEYLGVADTHTAQLKMVQILSDAVGLQETLRAGTPVTAADTVGIAWAFTAANAVRVVEQLRLSELVVGAAKYNWTVTERVQYADALRRFLGGSLAETLGMTQSDLPRIATIGALTDTLGLASDLAPKLVFRVTSSDTVGLGDTDVLSAIYNGAIADGLEISALYVAPGSITAWAVNTRTGATTEYQNFEFNSFAQMGGKYLAASDTGLYELTGDTDDGTNIVARIKSGFAQFAGSHLTSFKAAYLGVRGGGDYVLRLITGDGKTYDYGVKAENMDTTKIVLGKGLRARYFAFELISAGQDFDLDSVEFIPLVAQRRV